jgi:hypothetical protein
VIAINHRHLIEMVGEDARRPHTSDASADHGGVTASIHDVPL